LLKEVYSMGRYPVPPDFKHDDTEVRFFTKKSLIYTFAVGFPIGIGTFAVLNNSDHPFAALFVAIFVILPFYLFGRWRFPADDMYNGGMDLDKVTYIYLKKKLFGQKIYVTRDPEFWD